MQTYLEQVAVDARNESSIKNDYNSKDVYSSLHPDSLSIGNPLGKGTGRGGHTHSVPHVKETKSISYDNFDTTNGGGLYDIEGYRGVGGRNFLENISNYNSENEYGLHMIDTSGNEGQIKL